MGKFLKYTLLMLGATLSVLFLADGIYTYVFSHAPPRNKFEYILQMPPRQIDAVFLGSSRTANHIVTKEVTRITGKSAINLGLEGGVLEDNLLELKLLLSRKIRIKTLFLQVDFVFESEGVSNIANSLALPFIHNPVVRNHLKPQLQHFNLKYYLPFYRYLTADYTIGLREVFFSAIHKKPKVDLRDGFSPKRGNGPLKNYSLPKTIAARNKTIKAFQDICTVNHIRLVLFCAPFCSRTQHLDYIARLKEKLPGLRDYSSAFPDSSFYNCIHLNEEGARAFTRLLIEDDMRQAALKDRSP